MNVFLIAEVKVTDNNWVPEYAANVHKIAEKFGGKYFSRSGNITALEGPDQGSTLIAIVQFPSRDALERFANSPVCRGAPRRQHQSPHDDRRYRYCRGNFLSQGSVSKEG